MARSLTLTDPLRESTSKDNRTWPMDRAFQGDVIDVPNKIKDRGRHHCEGLASRLGEKALEIFQLSGVPSALFMPRRQAHISFTYTVR